MKKVEASKLNRGLKEILDAVAGGERYEITRYGKTVAKLLPPGAREPKAVEYPQERLEEAITLDNPQRRVPLLTRKPK